MPDGLKLEAPQFGIQAVGGNDVTFVIVFPYDATGGTHTLRLSLTPDGVAVQAYTSGSGLTVGAFTGGTTRVTVLIPRTFTTTYRKQTLYFSYQLLLSGVLRTQAAGRLTFAGDIYAP